MFDRSISINPNDAGHNVRKAERLMAMGQFAQAAEIIRAAIAMPNVQHWHFHRLSQCLLEIGDIAGAQHFARQAFDSFPEYPLHRRWMAIVDAKAVETTQVV